MAELDSLATIYNSLPPVVGVFQDGKVKLTEEELKAKPTYLYPVYNLDNLTMLSQKYRALGVLLVDAKVAALYNMDIDAYTAAMLKIATDINDPAFKYDRHITNESIKALYQAEKDNERLNFFWEMSSAVIIETLYVISQNSDKFLSAFDDKAALSFTTHVMVLKASIDVLSKYDSHIGKISEILVPLNSISANSVEQFRQQVKEMKPQIAAARAALLK